VQANAWLRVDTDGNVVFLIDRSEMGQGVYTGLPTLLAEELEISLDAIRIEAAPPGDVYINDVLGGQITGGSASIRDGWEKLRRAGAEARMRLIAAAADHWNVAASELRAENGRVVRADGESLGYGQLATAAAALPVPADIALKPSSGFSKIGQPRMRIDTPSKVDGTVQYGIDVKLPNMLYGALAQSPVLGGSVRSFDAARARQMPAVHDVVETSRGIVVVADSWWQARQARDALEIDWAPGPNADLDNAAISRGLSNALETRSAEAAVPRSDGDADAALAAAARKVEAVYELPMLAHATLEPQNCTVDPSGGEFHIYAPTQVQQAAHQAATAAAGVAPEKVFIHTTYLGGGFGRRLETDFIESAVEAARAIGRPLKLVWTREDDTAHDYYRPPYRHRCSAGFDADGKLTAWKHELCGPSITSRWAPAAIANQIDPFVIEAATNYPYDVPNVQVTYLQHEVGFDVGYWRSVSHATNCFSAECFMDELAAAAGQDPFEFRRALLQQQGETRWRRVLERAAARAGWGNAPEGRFQGIALMEGYGTYISLVAEISMDDGKLRVHKISGAADLGQMVNPTIVEAQIQGGIVFGLSAALWGDITLEGGQVQERNFDTIRVVRMNESPEIDVEIIASDLPPGGIGEPSVAVVAPAICNAIFAATGQRLQSLPIAKHGLVS
jgi:isoquinoline 1-oxidoreductase beta subunit